MLWLQINHFVEGIETLSDSSVVHVFVLDVWGDLTLAIFTQAIWLQGQSRVCFKMARPTHSFISPMNSENQLEVGSKN